jgi:hypothetical protein
VVVNIDMAAAWAAAALGGTAAEAAGTGSSSIAFGVEVCLVCWWCLAGCYASLLCQDLIAPDLEEIVQVLALWSSPSSGNSLVLRGCCFHVLSTKFLKPCFACARGKNRMLEGSSRNSQLRLLAGLLKQLPQDVATLETSQANVCFGIAAIR